MNGLLSNVLKKIIKTGHLTVTSSDGSSHIYGDRTGKPVSIVFTDKATERAIAIDPELQLGEAYMDERLNFTEGDIYSLLELVFTNSGPTAATAPWMRAINSMRRLLRRAQQMNTLSRSSKNVRHHYDLSGDIYRLFLDPDMQYSCAYFETSHSSLAEAQLAKKRHIAAKLQIKPNDELLDIGCGWGGLGLYFAQVLQAKVTGVTLSHEQHQVANQRAALANLSDRAKFLLSDYRLLNQKFDRISSVGMFEHVGVGHYQEYFDQVASLLKPDGVVLLHAIGRSDVPAVTNPFIRKYIFPGGYIPALSEVLPHIERSGLVVTDIEILRLHYADTLKAWRETFIKSREQAKAIYDERFCRMWEFYLAGSESAFRWQNMMVFQIQLAHRQTAVPLTRDYIQEEENRLKKLELQQQSANNVVIHTAGSLSHTASCVHDKH